MIGISADDDEEATGNRENGDTTKLRQHVCVKHNRSKSATENNLDVSRDSASHFIDKNEEHLSLPSTRPSRPQSPLHNHRARGKKNASYSHQSSLEKDIEQLQTRLQEEKSMRVMLEKAMGRVSSTLSPGHRHFGTQTKELIAEIESLEEEVANREQHVLLLYRSIFEHSVSRPSSQQNSSMASPVHTKLAPRKHPSIISSAFCSSKKFPLQPLQSLVSVKDSGKRTSKPRDASVLSGMNDVPAEKSGSNPFQPCQRVPTIERTSMLRTLKDHLYQCPSKVSEEMVRCMATLYCGLCGVASANRVEISWISTDKRHLSRVSCAINKYRVLVAQLGRVTVTQMGNYAQIAFWINVHNALLMHAYLAYGIPNSSLRRLALFHKYKQGNGDDEQVFRIMELFVKKEVGFSQYLPAAYNIGGYIVSANSIEQSIFRFHTLRIGWWLETILSSALRKKSSEERQLIGSKFGLLSCQPLVSFALCTGAFSDPMLRVYTASTVKEELEAAKRDFLQSNVNIKKSKKVLLPKLLERFARESSISSDDLLNWVTENVDKKLCDSIRRCIDHKCNKKASHFIEWLPYSSKFRYVFLKNITDSTTSKTFSQQ